MSGVFSMVAVLAAATLLGNWFLSELKKARAAGAPWYRPYMTIPGILVIIALVSPLFLRMMGIF